MYDPWVVDEFLLLLDRLEFGEAGPTADLAWSARGPSAEQLEVISATSAEEREFNELRRELPKAVSVSAAADALFRHLKRVIPAASFALYAPRTDTNELTVLACSGVGASALHDMNIPIGERISGWAFAHKQPVINSDATLELGPVARTFSVPLKYAMAVPIVSANSLGVITLYSVEMFNKDHSRLLESAATLFGSIFASGLSLDNQNGLNAPPATDGRSKAKFH
jgi:signal transduction protein with GAF and PtsI domain